MALLVNEEFNPWSGNISPDGIWRKAGVWFGTGNNELDPARAVLTSTYPGETSTGFLNLTITPSTNPLQGAEIQTLTEYGYGYYEVRLKPSDVSGGVASFFLVNFDAVWKEFDIEFLLNHQNEVTFSNYNGAGTTYYHLPFDPTAAFHTYGILWTPGPMAGTATVTNYVDGVAVHSETDPDFVSDSDGMTIMMNTWSGNPNFGGGPPAQNSTTVYDWVHFEPWTGSPPPPSSGTVSINNVSISEGEKAAIFTVTRSGGTAAFNVNFAISNGSATTGDGDYAAASGTLHFGDNQNTQTISVAVNDDTKVESNETFNVNLSNATNGATISDNLGIGTITNDDVAPPPPPETTITGTNKSDVLTSTTSNDAITSKAGQDLIVFPGSNFGNDTITDFRTGGARNHDTIRFDDAAIADFNSVLAHSAQVGSSVVITLDAGNTVTLLGVSMANLHSYNFE